jgi:hypothetical protein
LPVSRCPLSSESDRSPALQRNDAMGQEATFADHHQDLRLAPISPPTFKN